LFNQHTPLETLLEVLQNETLDERIRIEAIDALASLGDRVPLEILIEMAHHERPRLRKGAIEMLGKLWQRNHAPVDVFIHALSDENGEVWEAAVRALCRLRDRAPIAVLLQLLDEEHENAVVHWRLTIVQEIGPYLPIETLLDLAFHHRDDYARSAALYTLCEQAEQVLLEPVLALWRSQDSNTRICALALLSHLGERAPLDILVNALHEGEDSLRSIALDGLARRGGEVAIGLLTRALTDEHDQTRLAAADAFKELGEQAPLEPLLHALNDDNEWVRATVVATLHELGRQVPVEPLISLLPHEERSTRQDIICILAESNQLLPLEPLVDYILSEYGYDGITYDGEETVYDYGFLFTAGDVAIKALEQRRDLSHVEATLTTLAENYGLIYFLAVQELARQREHAPVDLLLRALHHPSPLVSQAAAHTLRSLGAHVSSDGLVGALSHPKRNVRRSALSALGDRAPIATVLRALHDRAWEVRREAVNILGALVESIDPTPLIAMLCDPSNDVREAAVRALKDVNPFSLLSP
jgi:HEAT repeat protein